MGAEKRVEEQIKKFLVKHNAYILKIHGSAHQKSGVPDIICCINGKFVAFEVKKPKGGTVKPLQIAHIKLIRKSKGHAWVVTSLEEVKYLLMNCKLVKGISYDPSKIVGNSVQFRNGGD